MPKMKLYDIFGTYYVAINKTELTLVLQRSYSIQESLALARKARVVRGEFELMDTDSEEVFTINAADIGSYFTEACELVSP